MAVTDKVRQAYKLLMTKVEGSTAEDKLEKLKKRLKSGQLSGLLGAIMVVAIVIVLIFILIFVVGNVSNSIQSSGLPTEWQQVYNTSVTNAKSTFNLLNVTAVVAAASVVIGILIAFTRRD